MPKDKERLKKELRLKLKEKQLERTCKYGRDVIYKNLKEGADSKINRRLINAIEDQNDKDSFSNDYE